MILLIHIEYVQNEGAYCNLERLIWNRKEKVIREIGKFHLISLRSQNTSVVWSQPLVVIASRVGFFRREKSVNDFRHALRPSAKKEFRSAVKARSGGSRYEPNNAKEGEEEKRYHSQ